METQFTLTIGTVPTASAGRKQADSSLRAHLMSGHSFPYGPTGLYHAATHVVTLVVQ